MLCTFHSCGFGSCPSLGMCRAQAGVCSPSCFRTRRPQSEALESPWDFCRRQPSSSHGRISVQGLKGPKSQGWAPAGGQPLGNAPSRVPGSHGGLPECAPCKGERRALCWDTKNSAGSRGQNGTREPLVWFSALLADFGQGLALRASLFSSLGWTYWCYCRALWCLSRLCKNCSCSCSCSCLLFYHFQGIGG